MTTDSTVLDALEYIVSLQDDDPELSELLMKAALEALEVNADQQILTAQHDESED